MADLVLIQERFVSGTGLLRIPTDVSKFRYTLLYLDVLRQPRNAYLNKNWNPPRGRYAYLVFRRKGYVIKDAPLEYTRQAFDGIADISGQALIAVKCAYEGILQSFVSQNIALGLNLISVTDTISAYQNLNLSWDEVIINCYSDAVIQARLFSLAYDTCNPNKDNQYQPPSPPSPAPSIPIGSPVSNISRPYADDTITTPFTGDTLTPPPVTDPVNGSTVFWNFSTNRNPRLTKSQAAFTATWPISNYQVTGAINVDPVLNATNWSARFTESGGVIRTGSAVGNFSPEDRPRMVIYLQSQAANASPWRILVG